MSDRFPLRSFTTVLFLVLASVILGVAAPPSSLLDFVQLLLISLSLLVALTLSGARPQLKRTVVVVTVVAVVAVLLGEIVGAENVGDLVGALVGLYIALAAPVLVYRGIRRTTVTVDLQTVAAVLSIYLFIGVAFSAVYGVIDALMSAPIFVTLAETTTSDRLYFAFITLSTVGYGDLTPATQTMRAAAVATAVIGQIYLVSVVAVVVSNLGRRSRMAPPVEGDQPAP